MIRGHFGPVICCHICSGNTFLIQYLQNLVWTMVWTMVWNSSRKWSGTCFSQIILVWNSSDWRRYQAQFERTKKIIYGCFREQIEVFVLRNQFAVKKSLKEQYCNCNSSAVWMLQTLR